MPKTHFLTFGGGENNQSYRNAVKRLSEQAKVLEIFDYIYPNTEIDLKNDDEFWKTHGDFIIKNTRGYGYWLWKPYLIKKIIEQIEDNDILLYADAGCIIQPTHKDELLRLFKVVETDLIIASLTCNEQDYSKMDLIHHLNMENDKSIKVNQRQGSTIMFKKCKETVDLVNEWYNISCNYHMIDDTPSIIPNVGSFKEHRHDQSIFSLLTKKYNIFSKESIKNGVYIARFRRGY